MSIADDTLSVSHLARSVIRLRCPVCLEGRVFKGLYSVRRNCAACGFFFSRESGYFLGSVYFGYGVTLGVALAVWFVLSRMMGMGWDTRVLLVLLAVVIVFPFWFFRYARILWLAVDLWLNPPVREDFEPRGR